MGGDPDPADVERVHDRKKALYGDFLDRVRPNTALLALLQGMRAAGHKLACVTTGSPATPPRRWPTPAALVGSTWC